MKIDSWWFLLPKNYTYLPCFFPQKFSQRLGLQESGDGASQGSRSVDRIEAFVHDLAARKSLGFLGISHLLEGFHGFHIFHMKSPHETLGPAFALNRSVNKSLMPFSVVNLKTFLTRKAELLGPFQPSQTDMICLNSSKNDFSFALLYSRISLLNAA